MPYTNPYIQKVQSHPRIFDDVDEIEAHKGNWESFFGNDHLVQLEIGTGLGNFLAGYAEQFPDINLVGMEIKYKRLWRTMEKCERVGRGDVVLLKEYGEKIASIFGAGELDTVFLFFPDPWPKKRHWKHRILQEGFLKDLHTVLRSGGTFIFKTDHEEYFDWGVELFESSVLFDPVQLDRDYESDKKHSHHNSTEFEMIWRSEGRKVYYLEVKKM